MSTVIAERLSLEYDGAQHFPAALGPESVAALLGYANGIGARLRGAALEQAIAPATQIAQIFIGSDARPVRAVMFDKTAEHNWALGWHQDRTIAVRRRVDVDGFGPWTSKQGILHVTPPAEILRHMVTLRLHLDPCEAGNAPLKIALGSHRLGLVPATQASAKARTMPCQTCLADVGDVWAYSTLILHASDRAAAPSRRRVLQVDYAAFDLPQSLEWLGVA